MRIHRLAIALTALNIMLVVFTAVQARSTVGPTCSGDLANTRV